MKQGIIACIATAYLSVACLAQQSPLPVPRLIRFSGAIISADSTPRTGVVGAMFSLYKEQQGGIALWTELQNVQLDVNGQYTVLLGSQHAEGVPAELFTTNEARWLGIQVEAEPEQPRVLLVSVPYALKAGDAETLGGKPLSSFLLNPNADASGATSGTATTGTASTTQSTSSGVKTNSVNTSTSGGTANYIARWIDASTLGNSSSLFDNGNVGIGTTNPAVRLEIAGVIGEALRMTGAGTNPVAFRFLNSGNSPYFGVEGSAAGGYFTGSLPFSAVIYSPSNPIQNIVGGVAKLTIASTGVGIGTSAPTSPLTVAGTVESTSGGFKFPDGSILTSGNNPTGSTTDQVFHVTQNGAGAGSLTIATLPAAIRGDSTATINYSSGVLGSSASPNGFGVVGENLATAGFAIGTFGVSTTSTTGTGVWGEAEATSGDAVGVYGKTFSSTGTGVLGYANATLGDAVGMYGRSDSTAGTGVWGDELATSGNTFGVYGSVASAAGTAGVFDNTAAGNLLLGRQGITHLNVFRVDSTGKGYFNGGTQTSGADFAESVEVSGVAADYKPGDVLIIDPNGYRRLALASEPYSTKVAGIYSTKPGVLATPHMMDDARLAGEIPLAVVGIVPCKVSTENGPIEPGDMLVSSSTPGYAMKGTERGRMLGAVVGKAMQSLKQGSGVIEVLVSLH